LVRGEFLSQAVRDYVVAAEAIGLPRWRIMFRHILPNTMAPLIITATFSIAGAVLTESGLAFVGLGDPTSPSWGLLLNEGRENINYAWLIYAPGFAVFVLVTCLNLIGNGLRDAFDPKSER
jgi:peptide/nickel transport system permease protein